MRRALGKPVRLFTVFCEFYSNNMGDTGLIPPNVITGLLKEWRGGSNDALESLIPLVHEELRRIARKYMRREHARNSLQTSMLVNEAYLRLVDTPKIDWQDRAHFFAVASTTMRRVLVDLARERKARKRGGSAVFVTLDDGAVAGAGTNTDFLAVDEALNELESFDKRKAQVVVMKFFGGLTEEEIAFTLKVSVETVRRDWRLAKVWLFRYLSKMKEV